MSNIRVYELGPTRWHMDLWFDQNNEAKNREFREWMADNLPHCLYLHHWNNGIRPFWELRGGDPSEQSLIVLMWAGNNN